MGRHDASRVPSRSAENTGAVPAASLTIDNGKVVAGNVNLNRRVAAVLRELPSRRTRHFFFEIRTKAKIASFKKRRARQRTSANGWARIAKQNIAISKLQHELRQEVSHVFKPGLTAA